MSQKISSNNAVIFDMDGVIFDSEKCVIECWQEIAEKYQIPNVLDACKECLGINRVETKEKWLKRYGQDFPYDDYKTEMSALFHSRYNAGRLPMKPGVKELLAELKHAGVATAIASSTRLEIVEQEIKDAGLYSYFDSIVGGDNVKRSKPEPDIFLKACELLKIDSSQAYVIEDSYNGIRAAYAAGAMPIMVPDLIQPDAEMLDKVVVVLPSLLEVKEYLFT